MKEANSNADKQMTLKKRFLRMLYLGMKQYRDPYYQGIAAQVAFFFILSIFPTILLFSQILDVFNLSLDLMGDWLDKNFSAEALSFLTKILEFRPQASTNAFLIVMAIWAASRIQFIMLRVSDYTYSDGQDVGNFWLDRVRSMIAVVVTIIMMVLVVGVLAYGEPVIRFLVSRFVVNDWIDLAWTFFRWPIAGAIYFFVIFLNYFMLPRRKLKARNVLPGTIFCAVGMLIVTFFYSQYTARAVNNNLLYGSMASVSVLMFWFYFISWVFVLGIILNKVWADIKSE
ncbi:MAG: YihY/virulence factor BrkB family protein [Eubacterium sp.]|nr:YihY/virulence factor BrkB family protein [Eubacterium sp.]